MLEVECTILVFIIIGLRSELIADNMSMNRFAEIKRFLHFVNNDSGRYDLQSLQYYT